MIFNFFMSNKERALSFLIYVAKCITGVLLVYLVNSFIPYIDVGWSLVSLALILSPEGKDSLQLAFNRIKGNAIGAMVGYLCLLIAPATIWMLLLALVVTMLLCYIFHVEAGVRFALVATIIVMLRRSPYSWDTALERIISVAAGSLIALLSTVIFQMKFLAFNQPGSSSGKV
jgi:uncharacterized membrane protein YgaE (UPF0421/DUF939 family)